MKPHLNQWLGMMAYTCHPNYSGKHKLEDQSPGQLRPYVKNNQHKKAGRVAQVVDAPEPPVLPKKKKKEIMD
jgi:hypothetical protein